MPYFLLALACCLLFVWLGTLRWAAVKPHKVIKSKLKEYLQSSVSWSVHILALSFLLGLALYYGARWDGHVRNQEMGAAFNAISSASYVTPGHVSRPIDAQGKHLNPAYWSILNNPYYESRGLGLGPFFMQASIFPAIMLLGCLALTLPPEKLRKTLAGLPTPMTPVSFDPFNL